MSNRSSVDTLRAERDQLLAAIRNGIPSGPITLSPDQRKLWTMFRVAVIEAQVKEHEYLNSLLPEPLTDERRQEIVDELYRWEAETNGTDYADMMDLEHLSDYSLVQDYEQMEEEKSV